MFRPWDGLAIAGPVVVGISHGIVDRTGPAALANMDLAIDSEGYIVAFKPDRAKNGVLGAGRSLDEVRSSAAMLAAASKYAGYDLPFPASIAGYHMTAIAPAQIPPNIIVSGRPAPFAAIYFSNDGAFRMIEIASYPVEQVPDLVRGTTPEAPLNMTAVQSFAYMDMQGGTGGRGIAGLYAYVSASGDSASAVVLGEKGGNK
jgi:hypothetical protein